MSEDQLTGAAIQLIVSGWPFPVTVEQATIYLEMLADIPGSVLLGTVRHMVLTVKDRPSIAVIRRACVTARDQLPNPEEAARQALAMDDWYARAAVPVGANLPPSKPNIHPVVAAAWRTAGPDSLPAVFARCYREAVEAHTVAAAAEPWTTTTQIGPAHG